MPVHCEKPWRRRMGRSDCGGKRITHPNLHPILPPEGGRVEGGNGGTPHPAPTRLVDCCKGE
eukprot:6464887-Prorocentrum_lima.AAC.1